MKTIFGTDFSQKAAAAGRAAAILAHRWGDTLIVATSLDDLLSRKLPQDINATLSAFVTDSLHSEAKCLETGGLPVEEHMLTGHPDTALATLASKEQARLMVVGSLGLRNGGWMLGSVADRLVEQEPCPTLVIRSSNPFEAWAKEEKPLRIFVAFDFTEVAEQALLWVKNLQAIGSCDVVIGYVDWPLGDESRLGLWWPPLQSHNPPEVQAILERELRSRAIKLLERTDVTVRCEPSMGQPDARLIEMARSEQADLIVTGTHQYDVFGRLWNHSVSRALLHHSPMSVLCVPGSHKEPASIGRAAINRVLAAVDLSEDGGREVQYAYEVVRNGGVVRLFHVATPWEIQASIGGYPYPVPTSKEEQAEILAEIRKKLNAMVPPDALANGISTEVSVIEAHDIAKAIRQEGERFGADVICVGAHNHSGLSRLTLGSVAQAVTIHSRRPVLVVHRIPQ